MGQTPISPVCPPLLSAASSPGLHLRSSHSEKPESPERPLITSLLPAITPRAALSVLTWAAVPRRRGARARHDAWASPTLPLLDALSGPQRLAELRR